MGGVASAVSSVVDAASDAVSTVGNAIEDVGNAVVDDVVKPVAKAVENTVKAAADDPVNTAIRVGAFVVGGPAGLAIANGTIALAQGASLQDAAMTAGKTYVIGQAGQMAGQAAGSAASEAGYGAYAANTAAGATSGATQSALRGGDLESGAIMGALGGASKVAAKDINDTMFEDWAREQAAKSYDNAPSPTEQDVLAADPSIKMDFPLTTPTTATGPGYYDETTGEFISDENGPLQSPLGEDSGAPREISELSDYDGSGKPTTFSSADTNPDQPAGYDALLTNKQLASGLNFAGAAILNNAMGNGPKSISPLQATLQSARLPFTTTGNQTTPTNWLGERELIGDSTGDPFELMRLRQLYDSLTPEMQQTLASNNGQKAPTGTFMQDEAQLPQMASGGSTNAWQDLVNSAYTSASTKTNQPVFMGGGQRRIAQMTPLTQLSTQLSSGVTRKAKGGLPALHGDIPKDHKPEFVTGHTGYYANGKGTGQSDDIPAVLQHGDFVVDADTVAALGDGSSKAGAQALEQFRKHIPVRAKAGGRAIPAQIADGEYVLPEAFVTALGQGDNARGAKMLDAMRHQIREHKRSAPTSKIPPKAKSPIEYIKMGKKG